MQPVLTAAQSRAFDKYLIEEIGISSLVLMENAARGALDAIEDWLTIPSPLLEKEGEILILCGPGNNGGDGLALARLLIARSYMVSVFLASLPEKLSPDARAQYDALAKSIDPDEIYSFEKSEDILEIVDSPDIVVDALLGTGSKGAPRGTIAEGVKTIQLFKEGGSKILALDIPTGIDADTGAFEADNSSNAIVRADRTVAMGAAKIGFYQADSKIFTGEISIANLGSEISFPNGSNERAFLVHNEDAACGIRTFRYTASKMDRGRVLAICGSRGMTGAAIMSATAALKAGCGLVTVAVPESQRPIIAQSMPELMTLGLTHETNGSPDLFAWDELQGQIKRADAILIGCGLPVILGTTALILRIISQVDKPMVIDAGALSTLEGHLDMLKNRTAPTILTPHIGELARLVDRPWQEVERERLEVGRHIAKTYNCTVVVKGEPVQTIASDGTAYINTTGNVGLATGGTGDVLAGMIVSLLAQTPDRPIEATRSAVYLHGLAGDFAATEKTTHGMTATDVITHLPNAFKALGLK
jgi:NAD(P)H-hydrate epimerase